MSIDNSMFAEYLSNISKNIKDSGNNIELELMSLNDTVTSMNTSLEHNFTRKQNLPI